MFTPQSQKAVTPDVNNLKIICPTEDTFLQ